jgi:uncharacterized protein YndB with AHSA1/START domain
VPSTSESLVIPAPAAEVWRAVTDLVNANRWNQAWQRVEYLSEQREGVDTAFRAYNDEGIGHNFRISEWVPEEYVAFVPVKDDPDEERYLITMESQAFRLRPVEDEATDVILIANVSGRGLRGWFAARFVWPAYQRTGLRAALEHLHHLFAPPEEDEEDGFES